MNRIWIIFTFFFSFRCRADIFYRAQTVEITLRLLSHCTREYKPFYNLRGFSILSNSLGSNKPYTILYYFILCLVIIDLPFSTRPAYLDTYVQYYLLLLRVLYGRLWYGCYNIIYYIVLVICEVRFR